MNLDTRVEQMEHELKVLKNEVQHILLGIQEEILNRTYPALRSSEEPAPEAKASSERQHRPEIKNPERKNPERKNSGRSENGSRPNPEREPSRNNKSESEAWTDVGFRGSKPPAAPRPADDGWDDEDDDEESDALPYVPHAREVSMEDIRHTPRRKKYPTHSADSDIVPDQSFEIGLPALAAWVSDSVFVVGREQTQQIIQMVAADRSIDTKISMLLDHLIDLAEENPSGANMSQQQTMILLLRLSKILESDIY